MVSNIHQPWKKLLEEPGPDGHIVQLYQDPDFYGEAISHFSAAGLVKGESIILVATEANWLNISARLTARGFNPESLRSQGQLTVLDANATLPKFLSNNQPDGAIFKDLARSTINKARADGRYPRVRWWGEMVNVLYVEGNGRGSTRLEELFDQVAHEEQIAIFCSFLMDKFDRAIYDGALGDVCRTHANLIPTPDYDVHRLCIDRAIASVFGPPDSSFIRSVAAGRKWLKTGMPSSQALLLWLRDAAPQKLAEVLDLARKHEASLAGGAHA